jgi:SAM-dependent methyltransferase
MQNEKLRTRESALALNGAVSQAQETHKAPDGVEDPLGVGQGRIEYQTLYPCASVQKRYDEAYFDRWYRGRAKIGPHEQVQRKVAMAVAATEYVLRRRILNAVDIGCGEAPWFTHLTALRSNIRYAGFDPSDYVVRKFGASRNVRYGAFADISSLNIRERFDLVVCADVLHYLSDEEIRRGVPAFVKLIRGGAYLEILTGEDEVFGDIAGLIRRPSSWYRNLFTSVKLVQIAPFLWITSKLARDSAALELTR